jgi:hypothetical protein
MTAGINGRRETGQTFDSLSPKMIAPPVQTYYDVVQKYVCLAFRGRERSEPWLKDLFLAAVS